MIAPVSKANAAHYLWGQACEGWHLLERSDLHVIHELMPQGAGETAHRHEIARQVFFVLSGKLGMEIEDTIHQLAPHDSLEIAPGIVHRAFNAGREPVEFLVISHPSTRGDRQDEPL
ncbi:cupin domain-containing protein [Pelagibacterium flavum]|uniref:Cupin domain-containing protein n=1 Tax=Pelagibacterium flavum TaxID=2984530 RepID=A0ABY6IT40_9HYPH|nr:cupin domain-containing protein [Pelagibacterium sp. YIM 151497]MAN75950.1 cupin [Hyphomicrobiales bacterium]UYQ72375.1 cupin domain-containing protein [Pelagibacterium sp. YIM 151497]|tara:strand:- start:731 stop:1081 length:351 start_codon:yes stop_codon:yes gene_type:complete